MTHAEALAGARKQREIAARMARIAANAREPFRLRYGAVILKEEAEQLAAQYDALAARAEPDALGNRAKRPPR